MISTIGYGGESSIIWCLIVLLARWQALRSQSNPRNSEQNQFIREKYRLVLTLNSGFFCYEHC